MHYNVRVARNNAFGDGTEQTHILLSDSSKQEQLDECLIVQNPADVSSFREKIGTVYESVRIIIELF